MSYNEAVRCEVLTVVCWRYKSSAMLHCAIW